MKKKLRISQEQAQKIGYTKLEKTTLLIFNLVFGSVAMAIFSFSILPIFLGFIPEFRAGSPPRSVLFAFSMIICCLAIGAIAAAVISVCGFALRSRLTSVNSRRLSPITKNSFISIIALLLMLWSIFDDTPDRYGFYSLRMLVGFTSAGVIVVSMIATYFVYRSRLYRDVGALSDTQAANSDTLSTQEVQPEVVSQSSRAMQPEQTSGLEEVLQPEEASNIAEGEKQNVDR